MGSNGKMLDLERDTVVADSNSTITTDFGMKVSNTDSWLRVATQDRTGPMLLEDPVGREKVSTAFLEIRVTRLCSTDGTTDSSLWYCLNHIR